MTEPIVGVLFGHFFFAEWKTRGITKLKCLRDQYGKLTWNNVHDKCPLFAVKIVTKQDLLDALHLQWDGASLGETFLHRKLVRK
jgi:hypothetical protein